MLANSVEASNFREDFVHRKWNVETGGVDDDVVKPFRFTEICFVQLAAAFYVVCLATHQVFLCFLVERIVSAEYFLRFKMSFLLESPIDSGRKIGSNPNLNSTGNAHLGSDDCEVLAFDENIWVVAHSNEKLVDRVIDFRVIGDLIYEIFAELFFFELIPHNFSGVDSVKLPFFCENFCDCRRSGASRPADDDEHSEIIRSFDLICIHFLCLMFYVSVEPY